MSLVEALGFPKEQVLGFQLVLLMADDEKRGDSLGQRVGLSGGLCGSAFACPFGDKEYLMGSASGEFVMERAHRDVTDTFFGTNVNNGNNNGVFIGGGQVGYNWQVGNAVLGVEADFDGVANNNNTGTVFIPALGPVQVTSNNRWITTVAARFAHPVIDRSAGGGPDKRGLRRKSILRKAGHRTSVK